MSLLGVISLFLLLTLAFVGLFFLYYLFSHNITILIMRVWVSLITQNYRRAVELANRAMDQIAFVKAKGKKKTSDNGALIRTLEVRAQAYIGLEDYASALSDAETWVRVVPNDGGAYYCRGWALICLDELDLAREDFQKALSLPLRWYTSKESVYHNLGLVEYIAGDYDASLRYYNQAIKDSSYGGQAVTHANMGIVYFRQNRMDLAWKAYEKASKLEPFHEHVRVGLAVLHAAEDDWDEALKIWRSLLKKKAHFADAAEVAYRYYRWTPSMAELTGQIIDRLTPGKPKRSPMTRQETLNLVDEVQQHKHHRGN